MASNIHEVSVRTAAGANKSLADYRGNVLLVVNVASECGYTPQYAGLEKLHRAYAGRKVSVLGFPCNDFGGQEPGTLSQIQTFCTKNYDVTFELFDKVSIQGSTPHPLFGLLQQDPKGGPVKWNFTKFLVGKDGQVLQMFPSKVEPMGPEIVGAIDAALA